MVYVDPRLISIYDSEYLERALYNPRLPKSLRIKIEYELYKRKYNYSKTTYFSTYINKVINYYKLEQLDNYYLCLGVAEFYISATPECYDL